MKVFLSPNTNPGPGIFEVSEDDSGALFCTCKNFKARNACKHAMFVQTRIDANNGIYPLEISSRATKSDADEAKKSLQAFRDFVIRFGRIEVF